jgi:hypothetical protein
MSEEGEALIKYEVIVSLALNPSNSWEDPFFAVFLSSFMCFGEVRRHCYSFHKRQTLKTMIFTTI